MRIQPKLLAFSATAAFTFVILISYLDKLFSEEKEKPKLKLLNLQFTIKSESCINYSPPKQEDEFQHIGDQLYGYSAFYDNVSSPVSIIRVIGMDDPKKEWNPSLSCHYFDSRSTLLNIAVGTKVISKDWNNQQAKSSLVFILCSFEEFEKSGKKPLFISIRPSNESSTSKNKFRIHYPFQVPNDENYEFLVASCVQPLHTEFERPLEVIEWIEFHKMLGVQHFSLYNYSVGPKTFEVLKSYQSQVSLLNWNLPFSEGVPAWGQFIAASDCVYRHRGVAKYVLTMDTDEFLIPKVRGCSKQEANYSEFFQNIWTKHENQLGINISAMRFQSKVAFDNWPGHELKLKGEDFKDLEKLLQDLKILTSMDFYPSTQTKFVFRPEYIVESGIHYVEISANESRNVVHDRDNDDGYYVHFRNCDPYYHQPNYVLENDYICTNPQGMEKDDYPSATFGEKLGGRVVEKVMELVSCNVLSYDDLLD